MGIQLREIGAWTRERKFAAMLLVAATLAIGILIGTVISGRVNATHSILPSGATLLDLPNPVSMSNAFGAIVERDEPAVVNISTTQVIERKGQPQNRGGGSLDPFHDFFNRFFDAPDEGPEAERSLGSGIIVDKKGFILTNNHVIEQATKIQVQLNTEPTLYTARVIGIDKETDLAVVKIEANRDLPNAKLGNSNGVHVGDWVLAIGSPFGLQATVTAGIISAKDRGNVGRQFQHFLQTDAPINPGNSGGPLVDAQGQVVGVNSAIATLGTGSVDGGGQSGSIGLGFAIPINQVRRVAQELVQTGKAVHPVIGAIIDTSYTGIGARIATSSTGGQPPIIQGGPSARAGLRPGDVIVAFDGKRVTSADELIVDIRSHQPGDKVQITFTRSGARRTVTLTLGSASSS